MKSVLAAILLLAFVLPLTARATDRQEIEGILKKWENAWNSHDMRAFRRALS